MKKKLFHLAAFLIMIQLLASCNSKSKNENLKEEVKSLESTYKIRHVMTKAKQDSLTPEQKI